MSFNILVLLSGTLIAVLSIVYGFDKIESYQDPLFLLVLVGMGAAIVSYIIQPFLNAKTGEKNKNASIPKINLTPQTIMIIASLLVVVFAVAYLYSTLPKTEG